MATGQYSCSSSPVSVSDNTAVQAILNQYNTHNQCLFDGQQIKFSSPSDTLNITKNGQGAQVAFLTELAPYLEEELHITNVAEPAYEDEYTFTFVVYPSGDVRRLHSKEENQLLS